MKKILCILLLFSLHAGAQQQLNLQDAISIALKNSLDIQLAKNSVEQNTILNNYGVAGGLPVVTGSASNLEQITTLNQKLSNGTTTDRTGVAANSTNAAVTASMLLYNGMHVVSTKKRLQELQNQSEQVLNSQIMNTIAGVMTKYFDIVRQQSYTKTIQQSIEASQEQLKILQVRKTAGLANNADIFQAQIDLNTLLQAKQSQELVIENAKADLLTLLTLNADSVITVSDTILVDNSLHIDSVLTRLTTNPDIIAADQQIKINQYIVKEVAAQRYPALRFNTGLSYSRSQSGAGFTLLNQTYGPTLGLTLAVPIYNGSAYKRQQKVAEIDVKNATLQKQTLIRDYSANAVKTYQAYINTLQQSVSQTDNYKLAKKLLDLTMLRFELRQATILEVREAQKSFENAGYLLVNLAYAAKAAEIELKRITYTLTF